MYNSPTLAALYGDNSTQSALGRVINFKMGADTVNMDALTVTPAEPPKGTRFIEVGSDFAEILNQAAGGISNLFSSIGGYQSAKAQLVAAQKSGPGQPVIAGMTAQQLLIPAAVIVGGVLVLKILKK